MPHIRQASAVDIPRMQEIAVLAWNPIFTLYEHIMGKQLFYTVFPDWRNMHTSSVASLFEKHPQWTLVIEEDEKVVGFLAYDLNEEKKIGEIEDNAIHPDYQGRGLAGLMYREALRKFRESGMLYAKVGTWLDDAHIPARAAYEKLGFKQVIRGVQYYMKL